MFPIEQFSTLSLGENKKINFGRGGQDCILVFVFVFSLGFLFVCLFVYQDRVSLCSLGCPGTQSVDQADRKLRDPPAAASLVPEDCMFWDRFLPTFLPSFPPFTGMSTVLGVFLKSSVIHLCIVQSTLPCREGRTLLHEAAYWQDLHNGASPALLPSSHCGKGLGKVVVQLHSI